MASDLKEPKRRGKDTFTERVFGCWGDGGPRRTGLGSPERLPGGSEHGDFQAVYNFFQDKHCIQLLSYCLTLAFQIRHSIVSSHKLFLQP